MSGASSNHTVLTIAGRKIALVGDENDPYFKSLAAFHADAQHFENYARRTLCSRSVCFDVGASLGLTAILLSIVCPEGEVYAFEASPKNAGYLRENLRLNDIRNCTVVEAAVGDRPGTVVFRESVFGAGSHVVCRCTSRIEGPSLVTVPLITLDNFVDRQPVEQVHFMKVDVEGYEPAVLAGAGRLMKRDRPDVFLEFNAWCLQLFHGFNHVAFAEALAGAFHMSSLHPESIATPVGKENVYSFLHRNMFQHSCVDDLLIKLRPDAEVPSLAEMTKSGDDLHNLRELGRVQAELESLRSEVPASALS